jgi:hypothetical protein
MRVPQKNIIKGNSVIYGVEVPLFFNTALNGAKCQMR